MLSAARDNIDGIGRVAQASDMPLLHASCVDVAEQGVLIRGAPGSGKSDLAIRLIDGGGRLVADDYVNVEAVGGRAVAVAPEEIAGQIEARGVGLLRLPYTGRVGLALIVDLVPREKIDRLPDEDWEEIDGVRVRRIDMCAHDASAAAKIRLLLASKPGSEESDGN